MSKANWLRNTCLMIVFCMVLGISAVPGRVFSQENMLVPDVIGLNVPQAAALLNQNGINLGIETNITWTADAGVPENTIGVQSIAAGERVTPGTTIDVTVLRSANTLLIYDDNDLTLVNQSGAVMRLDGLNFFSIGGSSESSFTATRWTDELAVGDCARIWSQSTRESEDRPECPASTYWLATQQAAAHFWLGTSGATQFRVEENGIERAVCPVANPGTCAFFLAGGGSSSDVTGFVYFAYTPDQLIVHNVSESQWMLLDGSQIVNNAPAAAGSTFAFASAEVFGNPQVIGSINRLAPGQCLHFTGSATISDSMPEMCDAVARLDLDPSVNFWVQPFGVASVTDDQAHTCPAAIADKLTVCIMPR